MKILEKWGLRHTYCCYQRLLQCLWWDVRMIFSQVAAISPLSVCVSSRTLIFPSSLVSPRSLTWYPWGWCLRSPDTVCGLTSGDDATVPRQEIPNHTSLRKSIRTKMTEAVLSIQSPPVCCWWPVLCVIWYCWARGLHITQVTGTGRAGCRVFVSLWGIMRGEG